MAFFRSTLNGYGHIFSGLTNFAFSPFPLTLFTLPVSLFAAPFIAASFLPIMLLVGFVGMLSCLCEPSYGPGYGGTQRVVVDNSYNRGWGSWLGMGNWFNSNPTRPYTDYSSTPSAPYTAPTQATGRVWTSGGSSTPQQPYSALTHSSSLFGGSQHVNSGPNFPSSAPSVVSSYPAVSRSAQFVR